MLTRRKIVAVVDDDPSTLKAMGLLLDAHGIAAKLFGSAESFLEGGASGSTIPVIFMTALDDAAIRAEALQAGCVAYLQKPVLARHLMDAIYKAAP